MLRGCFGVVGARATGGAFTVLPQDRRNGRVPMGALACSVRHWVPRELKGAHVVADGPARQARADGGLARLCSAGVLGFRGAVLPQLERRQGSTLFFPFRKNKQFKLKYSRTGKLRKIRYNTPEREK